LVRLRAGVRDELARRGIEPRLDDTLASLRERLNDVYLEDVRRLRERQRAGEIPLGEYARHTDALKDSYPLLGLPLDLWEDGPEDAEVSR
jgi:hypothetical protein